MPVNILNTEILWLPNHNDIKDLQSIFSPNPDPDILKRTLKSSKVSWLKKRLSSACDVHINFTGIKPKAEYSYEYVESCNGKLRAKPNNKNVNASAPLYVEMLCSIACEFHLNKSLEDSFNRLVQLFCSCGAEKDVNPEWWLNFDLTSLSDKNIKSSSTAIKFKNFSLGNIVGLNTFVKHFDSDTSLSENSYKITQIKGKFLHDFQRLELYFVVGNNRAPIHKRSPQTHRLFKMKVPYASIHRVLLCSTTHLSVYFHLLLSPLLYAVVQDEEQENYIVYTDIGPETDWEREVDLFKGCSVELKRIFNKTTVLKLDFVADDYDTITQLIYHCKLSEVYFTPMKIFTAKPNIQVTSVTSKTFDCFYALKCITSRSLEVCDQLMVRDEFKQVNKNLEAKSIENAALLTEVLFHIYNAMDQGNIVIFSSAVNALYAKLGSGRTISNSAQKSTNDKQGEKVQLSGMTLKNAGNEIVKVRRAILTPTHVRFLPPLPTLKSRLLRTCNSDYTLRISVKDDNLNGLNFTVKTGSAKKQLSRQERFFDEHVKAELLKGIKIGNRHYKYLGGSTSQLRSHGVWFYAKDNDGRVASDLRNTIGYLDDIHLVPKYMARMGQSFSQAMGYIRVYQTKTNINNPEKDVLGYEKDYLSDSDEEDDKPKQFLVGKVVGDSGDEEEEPKEDVDRYNFSDGIGRISEEIAHQVYQKLELENEKPSAFQIRYAGCKGMLVIDPRLKGERILFRDSMKKYNSDSDYLEILKTSKPRAVFLNRQFITILEQMGINKDVFIHLQREMIQHLIKSMLYDDEAALLLAKSSQLLFNFKGLLEVGFSFTEDPLFRSMILAIFNKEVGLLKTKARIEIPIDEGRTMFGVLDETFSLEYGEVFIQYTKWESQEIEIVTGTVLVTKNPCMHPGDVRKFQAVDIKGLKHIRDCIVFPAKGPRPHPDEMAGSDLDGDEYSVVWHQDLIFEKDNYPPMLYATRKDNSQNLSRPITIEDELSFFCRYILNENVGLLANAHLAWADKLDCKLSNKCKANTNHVCGIYSTKCMDIAKKYSKALDFAKTGKSAMLSKGERVFSYPDFMEKLNEKTTYLSNKALGFLYRNCKRLELALEATTDKMEFNMDKDLIFDGWEVYEESALDVLQQYSNYIHSCLKAYGIDNEGELVSGALVKVSNMFQERHDFSDLINILEYEVKWLLRELRKEFLSEFNVKEPLSTFTSSMLKKASAWYVVTYSQSKENVSKYFGLPWCVTDVLIEIKKLKVKDKNMARCSILEKKVSFVEAAIDKYVNSNVSSNKEVSALQEISKMLDAVYVILNQWLKSQNLVVANVKELENCLSEVFESVSSEVYCCDESYIQHLIHSNEVRKIASPGYYIIKSLMDIAMKGTEHFDKTDLSETYQEFGLIAWITLVKLACSCNPNHLSISASTDSTCSVFVTHEDEIETIQLPLFQDRTILVKEQSKALKKFSEIIIHDEENVKQLLKEWTKVKDIDIRSTEDRGKRYSVRITVQGSRFAIERLKGLVVQKWFYKKFADRIKIQLQEHLSLKDKELSCSYNFVGEKLSDNI